jgi:hypothetical protein
MQRYSFVSILFLLLFVASVSAQEHSVSVNFAAEGSAVINSNDIAGAREEAIRDALLEAVSHAAAQILLLAVNDKRLETLKDALNDQLDKYINNYKITAEKHQSDTYFVNTSVNVALALLNNDLQKMGIVRTATGDKNNVIVSLSINGLKKYSDFSNLREFLKNRTRIVKNIHPRSFEWQQAYLELEISGSAQALAEELARTGKYILDTKQIDKNQIAITFMQRGEE